MSALDLHAEHFAALYEKSADPWNYAVSPVEAFKRQAVTHALGAVRRGVGLELGCGNGVSTVELADRFARLIAVDGSERAVALARDRTQRLRTVTVLHRRLPDGFPPGTFDAVIASEVLYYLPRPALEATLRRIRSALHPGGRFVSVNSTKTFSDSEVTERELAERSRRAFGEPRRRTVGPGWRLEQFVPTTT